MEQFRVLQWYLKLPDSVGLADELGLRQPEWRRSNQVGDHKMRRRQTAGGYLCARHLALQR